MSETKINSKSSLGGVESTNKPGVIKILNFIIQGSIALVFFMVPLFFTNLTSQGFGFDKIILFYFLVLVGVVAWVTKGIIAGELFFKKTPLDIPILITLALFGISTGLSISAKDSLIGSYGNSSKGLFAVMAYTLFFYLVINNINLKNVKLFFGAIVTSGFLLSVYSLLQINGKYFLPMGFTHDHGVNPIGSLSGLTMYLVIILPLFVVLASQIKEMLPNIPRVLLIVIKTIAGFSIVSSLAVLALLNGFTFWPIPVVGMVILLMFFMSKIIKISTKNLAIPLLTFLILIIFLVIGNFQIGNLNLPAEVSLSRGASWDIAKGAVRENPIFGSGLSTFDYSFSKFKNVSFNMSPLWNIRFDSATGALFELLATVGVPGAVMVIVLLLISISILFLTLIKNKSNEMNSIVVGLFASFISVVLSALLFPQNNSMIILSVIILVLAVAAGVEMYPEKFKEVSLSFRAEAKYALTLAAVFLFVISGVVILFTMGMKMYMADVYAKQSSTIEDLAQKGEKLNRAIDLAGYQDVYYINSANNYMAIANKVAMDSKDQDEVANSLGNAIEQGKKALLYAPNKAANNESLALIYENASFYTRGALDSAAELYKKVSELDPQNPTPYLRMALVNMAKANAETAEEEKKYYIEEAIKKYNEAIAKKGDLAAAFYGKAIASEKLNKIDEAIEQLKNANLIARDNLDYRFELGRLYFNRGVADPSMKQDSAEQGLNVQPQTPGSKIKRNADLNTAEQLFLSILLDPAQGGNPNHANARYSLAVLYQKIGENDKAKLMADYLVNNVLQDQETKDAVNSQFKNLQ